jgi:hypothetical protein
MRTLALISTIALGTAAAMTSSAAPPAGAGLGQARPERSLTCNPAYPGGCKVSCATSTGQTLFVHGDVTRAFITDFAGNHTLLEIQKGGDLISVLVGDVSYCTLEGLRDTALL